MIELKNIMTILKGKVVHNNLNLIIEKGKVNVIIGGSGSGKSVLIKIINKLLEPESGEILIDGEDILKANKTKLVEIREKMGVIFQGAALFDSMTVFENVAFPLVQKRKYYKKYKKIYTNDYIRNKVEKNLNMVGLKGMERKMPAELSGGMAKRVGIARSLIIEPEYIFYDEPTTGLDNIMANIINRTIIDMKKTLNITSIVVTHDMNSVFEIADKVAMIYDGKIIFDGNSDELRMSENIHLQNFINGKAEDIPEKLRFL